MTQATTAASDNTPPLIGESAPRLRSDSRNAPLPFLPARYHGVMSEDLRISKPMLPWPKDRTENLRRELSACRDVAFAHLPEVLVPGRQAKANRVLFVWLVPDAMGALRGALNTICDATARALPKSEFVDVVVLNSAPELLLPVEDAGCLFVERNPEERAQALEAARAAAENPEALQELRMEEVTPWWAFWRR